jgi:3-deoxy-D-manno-octulosonate 8-phosphate phosphatase (KDO 8-P phosphatase)
VAAQPERGRSRADGAPTELSERLARTRLLVLDVDGVLTDGKIVYGAYGPADETPRFHVQDGLGLRWLSEAGVAIAWVTGRGCVATTHRAKELGIDEVHQKVARKSDVVREIQSRRSIDASETVAMGDDLPDLGLRAAAGTFVAPANARDEIKSVADLVTQRSGGDGAVRELCEHILRAQGRWQAILDSARR